MGKISAVWRIPVSPCVSQPLKEDSHAMVVGGYGKRRADGHALMGLPPIPEEHLNNGPEMPGKRLLDAFPF